MSPDSSQYLALKQESLSKQSADRKILEVLAAQKGRASIAYLIEATGLSQATLYRWVAKLETAGSVTLDGGVVALVVSEKRAEKAPEKRAESLRIRENGEKILTDSQAFSAPHTPKSISGIGGSENNVQEAAKDLGLPSEKVEDWVASYGVSAVLNQFRNLRLTRRYGTEPINHPVAWLQKGLERSWEPLPALLAAEAADRAKQASQAAQEGDRAALKKRLQDDADSRTQYDTLTDVDKDARRDAGAESAAHLPSHLRGRWADWWARAGVFDQIAANS